MMEIRLNLYQADRDFQVEIGGGGFGYRLFGPKFDGSSRLIKSVILSERDKEEIVRFVKPDAEAVERERDSADERARMLNFQKEKLEAALAAAQGEVERLKMELEATRKELGDKTWRLRRPYEAWLSDSLKKDNCRNCKHSRPPTIAHNPDRVSCQYADGWPHWTNKCDRWEAQEAIGGKAHQIGKEANHA